MGETWWVAKDELDDDQKAVIALPLKGSYLVEGPPGSGKTNLLLLRANYMTLSAKPNILVIVFTRTLREFIASGAHHYDFDFSKVMTCLKWQQDFLWQYNINVNLPDGFEERRAVLIDEVKQLVRRKKLRNLYDGILLDETQDLLPDEIEIFSKLGQVIFAVADSRQKIYRSRESIEMLRSIVDKRYPLRFHYRNGVMICKFADAIAKESEGYEPLETTCNYDEKARPSSVENFSCKDIDDQARRIMKKLPVQLKAYPDELLGVVCPTRNEVSLVGERIKNSPLGDVATVQGDADHVSFDPDTHICVCTIHAAKGLEFRTLHLAGCEFLRSFPLQRNLVFTAVTRAKTSLSLYYSDTIPGFLESALNTLQPAPDLPDIEDVFGKKR